MCKFIFAVFMAFLTAVIQFYTADVLKQFNRETRSNRVEYTVTNTYSSLIPWQR